MDPQKLAYRVCASFNRKYPMLLPSRILHWLGAKAYNLSHTETDERQLYQDNGGFKFYLNPYYYLDRQIISFGIYEEDLHHFIDTYIHPKMICFDVGANIGYVTIHLGHQVGPHGKVFSFEPVPYIYKRLVEHIQLNSFAERTHPHPIALCDTNGQMTLHTSPPQVSNQGMSSLVYSNSAVNQSIQVATRTLDQFVQEHALPAVHFIKIDIQGAEPLFIKGAEQTLRKHKPILVFEVSELELARAGATPRTMLKQIEDLGYSIFWMKKDGKKGAPVFSHALPHPFPFANLCAFAF